MAGSAVDGVSLAPDLLCIASGACDDAAALLAALPAAAFARRVALVRAAFLPDGAAAPPLSSLMRPLGHGVIAVASRALQAPEETRLVDEWTLPAAGDVASAPAQTAEGVQLPRYLTQRGFQVRCAPDVAAALPVASAAAQSTDAVLMVAPCAFASNEQAAADNAFMARPDASGGALRSAVLAEHAGLYAALTRAGVRVRLFSHTAAHNTPDAVFPNNWFSLCAGTLTLYPMKCTNRAAERRADIVAWLRAQRGAGRLLDLTSAEQSTPRVALEGTGTLVLDHLLRCAFMARSERSDHALGSYAAAQLGFTELHEFDATDDAGRPVYHTNVVLSVGTGFAVVCADAVDDAQQRAALLAALARGGRDVVAISRAQMGSMCGNVLELRDGAGVPLLAMSQRAHDAFTPTQRGTLLQHVGAIVAAPLDTLERVGGGSVRCCLAELFDS